jgi:glycerophosphoryl diester phosphodiesterase
MVDVVLVCHRGASALAAENSLEAFRVAMQHGVDFSELDVHVARDGDLVVSHDPVDDIDAERALPRLAEVFDLVRGRMGIYVELKGAETGAALGDLVRAGVADDVPLIVGSEHLTLVEEVRQAALAIPRSILFRPGAELCGMIAACREHQAAYAHPCFRPIDASLIDALHAAGLRVMTPHTNDASEARRFLNIGVDVIASDDPRVLLPLRG